MRGVKAERVTDAEYRRRRLSQGMCESCTRPALPGKVKCDAHTANHKAREARRRAERLAANLCLSCGGDTRAVEGGRYCRYHMDQKNETTKRNNRWTKVEVFNAYGGCRCACCGETNIDFLTIDHMNNDGAEHRRKLFGKNGRVGGTRLYLALKREGYPPGLRVLCFNCNIGRGIFGQCPHERARQDVVGAFQPFTFIA